MADGLDLVLELLAAAAAAVAVAEMVSELELVASVVFAVDGAENYDGVVGVGVVDDDDQKLEMKQ